MLVITTYNDKGCVGYGIELEESYSFVSGLIQLFNTSNLVKSYTIQDKETGLFISDYEQYAASKGLKPVSKLVNPITETAAPDPYWSQEPEKSLIEFEGEEMVKPVCARWSEIYREESGLKVTTPIEGKGLAHDYVVEKGNGLGLTTIQFQNGPIPQVGVNGLTNEALLSILIHRTSVLNGLYPCQENMQACNHMLRAKKWFDQRTINRKARGVEGTYQK